MLGIDFRGFNRHGAIHEYREGGRLAIAEHPAQQAGNQLRAAHGERRHENLAAGRDGVIHDGHKLFDGFIEGPVVAGAVGGFDENHVGFMEWLVVAQNGRAARAEVAGKHNFLFAAVFGHGELDGGGAEHVAGFRPGGADAGGDFHGLLIGHGAHHAQRAFGVFRRIKGRDGRFAGARELPVFAGGVSGQNMRGIAQDEAGHFDGGGCGVHRHAMALLRQQRQPPGVVQMRVRDGHGVELDSFGRFPAVEFFRLALALKLAAIHQDAGTVGLHVVGGTGDFATAGASDMNVHGVSPEVGVSVSAGARPPPRAL